MNEPIEGWDEPEEIEEEEYYESGDRWVVIDSKIAYHLDPNRPIDDNESESNERVITPSLLEKLSGLEIAYYQGDTLRRKLYQRARYLMGSRGSLLGWSVDDMVQEVFVMAERTDWRGNETVLSTWMQQLFTRLLRDEQNRPDPTPNHNDEEGGVIYDIEDPGFRPTILNDEWVQWLKSNLTKKQFRAVMLTVEKQMTQEEVAEELRITQPSVNELLGNATRRIKTL